MSLVKVKPSKQPYFAVILITVLMFGVSVIQAQDDLIITVETVVLNIPVVVTDKSGRPLVGLRKDDFEVTINGAKQPIDFFDDKGAVNIALIIDAMSNTSEVLGRIRRDAQKFVDMLGQDERAMVIKLDGGYKVICELTSDRRKLRSAIGSISSSVERARTMDFALHQAIFDELAGSKGKKAVLVFGDPDSALRWYEYGDKESHYARFTPEFLSESDAAVYPIFYQTSTLPRELIGKTLTLEQLFKMPPFKNFYYYAVLSGGRYYAAGADNFRLAFDQILSDIRSQYVIGVHVDEDLQGKERTLSLATSKPGLQVRTKQTIRAGIKDERKKWVQRYRVANTQAR